MNDFLKEENQIVPNPITLEPLGEALSERYLNYALSTIMHRALPDARDGLKPVHRRILFAMRELKLDSSGTFRKCAKIVGEVMGNFHPHGDKAIYDALARLAQDFSVRYPLVDGQGNFGNIDGDNPAAQRYTEARLTKVSELMLDGLAENSVAFRDNYDGSESEPVVLPSGFPQLMANGSSGIAVGIALPHTKSFSNKKVGLLVEAAPVLPLPSSTVLAFQLVPPILVKPSERIVGKFLMVLMFFWSVLKDGVPKAS